MSDTAAPTCEHCGGTVRVEHVSELDGDGIEHRRPEQVCDCPDE